MVFTKKIVFFSLLITLCYLLFIVYAMNFTLINTISVGNYPILFKINLFSALALGLTTTMTNQNLIFLIINALLTGFVLSLTIQKLTILKKMGNVHLVAGGSSLLGIVSGGCVSCGLPLLSLFGLTGSLLYLPFKGAELPYIAFLLLSLSLVFLIRNNRKEAYCEVPKRRKK